MRKRKKIFNKIIKRKEAVAKGNSFLPYLYQKLFSNISSISVKSMDIVLFT